MRYVEINKAIVEYYNVKGVHAYEVQVSLNTFSEVCKELGWSNNISYAISGVPIRVMRGLGDDRINILGPAGQVVYPMMINVPTMGQIPPPPPPSNNYVAQVQKFIADFLQSTNGAPANLIAVSHKVFKDIAHVTGALTYNKQLTGMPYPAIHFQYSELFSVSSMHDDECVIAENEHSPPVNFRFHPQLVQYPPPSPVAPGSYQQLPPPPNNNGRSQAIPSGLLSGMAIQQATVPRTIPIVYPTLKRVCECGSEKVGSPAHSRWCPKH